jgi:hypothetical protein
MPCTVSIVPIVIEGVITPPRLVPQSSLVR